MAVCAMSNIRLRPDTGKLFFDFHFMGVRCREYTSLSDAPTNRKRMQHVLDRIEAEITLGTFEYAKYFPNSKVLGKLPKIITAARVATDSTGQGGVSTAPLFKEFVETWLLENEVRWRQATREMVRGTLGAHLTPKFGEQRISEISRADLLQYRAELSKIPGRSGNEFLSPKTINHYIGILKSILAEGADRHGFKDPSIRIGRLKVPRKDIEPFTLDQVTKIINAVRADFKNYYIVRSFTGMRSGEVHGLRWMNVDFGRRQILVRETFAKGRSDYTKNDGSQREVDMSSTVYEALKAQAIVSMEKSEYVFCDSEGGPLDSHNVVNRVWYPLLRHLGFKRRRPYQLRHACATFWIASGENPEWIARQLGHTTTEMLFRVYSRYVPNLTRRDGSAFDNMVTAIMHNGVVAVPTVPTAPMENHNV